MYEIMCAKDIKVDLYVAVDSQDGKIWKFMIWDNKRLALSGVSAINKRKIEREDYAIFINRENEEILDRLDQTDEQIKCLHDLIHESIKRTDKLQNLIRLSLI